MFLLKGPPQSFAVIITSLSWLCAQGSIPQLHSFQENPSLFESYSNPLADVHLLFAWHPASFKVSYKVSVSPSHVQDSLEWTVTRHRVGPTFHCGGLSEKGPPRLVYLNA